VSRQEMIHQVLHHVIHGLTSLPACAHLLFASAPWPPPAASV
jgi:hypothetical protein